MAKESEPELFTGELSRVTRSISTPGEAEGIIQQRLAALGFETFQEYVASLIAYDCWAEKPHLLTGEACKGHKGNAKARAEEKRLWAEIVRDFGKPDKTGSFFARRVAAAIAKMIDPSTKFE